MNRTYAYLILLLLGGVGMLTLPQLCRRARSYTGEFAYAACADNLNCGNCLLGWKADPQCASGTACIAFRVPGGFDGSFKACTPGDDVNDWCNTGVAGQTIHTCSNGFYRRCACVEYGDCPPSVKCNCNWAMPTGPMATFIINSVCY